MKNNKKSYTRKTPAKSVNHYNSKPLTYHVPLTQSAITGIIAENLVRQYLKSKGWKINDRNYKTQYGEIDIIASKNNEALKGYPTYIFVEVKAKRTSQGLAPETNVTQKKQYKLTKTIKTWIAKHPKLKAVYRCDVAAVTLTPKQIPRLKYIPSAFYIKQDFGW